MYLILKHVKKLYIIFKLNENNYEYINFQNISIMNIIFE